MKKSDQTRPHLRGNGSFNPRVEMYRVMPTTNNQQRPPTRCISPVVKCAKAPCKEEGKGKSPNKISTWERPSPSWPCGARGIYVSPQFLPSEVSAWTVVPLAGLCIVVRHRLQSGCLDSIVKLECVGCAGIIATLS